MGTSTILNMPYKKCHFIVRKKKPSSYLLGSWWGMGAEVRQWVRPAARPQEAGRQAGGLTSDPHSGSGGMLQSQELGGEVSWLYGGANIPCLSSEPLFLGVLQV